MEADVSDTYQELKMYDEVKPRLLATKKKILHRQPLQLQSYKLQ